MNKPTKTYPTIGACGLDCGLCTRYYTVGVSRCPGCCGPDFFDKHPTCSIITCCVKEKNLEVCGECPEFPCDKFEEGGAYYAKETPSYPPYRKMIPNLNFIKEHGIEAFVEQQRKRIGLLETMIANFDDGRSRSFFCKATALLDVTDLENSLDEAARRVKTANIKADDIKAKAKILKEILNEIAVKEGVESVKPR